MKKPFLVKIYEWDCLNGDVLHREHYIVYAKDKYELREKCEKLLEGYLGNAEEGWEEVVETDHSSVFTKDESEIEVGYEVVMEIKDLDFVRRNWTIIDEI